MEDLVLIGRTEGQAPEIDGGVYLSEVDAAPGEFVDVMITDAREYDLMKGRGAGRVERAGETRNSVRVGLDPLR